MNRTISRRAFLTASAYALLAAPLAAEAQPTRRIPRVGLVCVGRCAGVPYPPFFNEFKAGLRSLGWIEGQNIELRFVDGTSERLPELYAELVRAGVDVILAPINEQVIAARQATSTIPIVMVYALDPVASGFVASLSRPGANVTGTTWDPGRGRSPRISKY